MQVQRSGGQVNQTERVLTLKPDAESLCKTHDVCVLTQACTEGLVQAPALSTVTSDLCLSLRMAFR